ncbi:hypothetical protein Q2T42_19420 [Leptolyngbya boryana CZ1]|uniref:O-antigen ligase-related domain-containing protein n=1 Tax=Leptolyngbya boryana CZ1 TaxID=3060204 RepID=A0AA97AU85_LEPBY|nr:hypothetical protein [Leptolyngbya boryana]WNZ44006.1 hypothetical protein Q2T42_19420 [Leptolyngbya boryana CZ1]
MNSKIFWSSFFFSLYLQGLSLYFYITGVVGGRSSEITAVFQCGSLLLFTLISLNIKEYRQNLLRFEFVDILMICFFVLGVIDLSVGNITYALPQNILIYFTVYSFSQFVARGLTFKQFQTIFYLSTLFAFLASALTLASHFMGVSSLVNNGARLATGSSQNPIEAGTTGAYALLMCFFLSMRATALSQKLWFLVCAIPGGFIAILSGTRSATIAIVLGVAFILGSAFLFYWKTPGSIATKQSSSSVAYNTLIALACLFFSVHSFAPTPSATAKEGLKLDKTLERIGSITAIVTNQVPDESVGDRYNRFGKATSTFLENPLTGGKIYSSGFVHNAFLQAVSDYGLLGFATYVVPFIYAVFSILKVLQLSYRKGLAYLTTEAWMITAFAVLLLIQALVLLLIHVDPYRTYLTPCIVGMLIAFSRLRIPYSSKLKTRNVSNQPI